MKPPPETLALNTAIRVLEDIRLGTDAWDTESEKWANEQASAALDAIHKLLSEDTKWHSGSLGTTRRRG